MEIIFTQHEYMLFALLRAAIHQYPADTRIFQAATPKDWKQCRAMAVEHGVMALAWDGILTLPTKYQPPLSIKLNWALAVEKYEKQYEYYCHAVHDLSNFYAEHGIATVQLKGVGLSSYYPIPSHREGGDIDIYTYSADKQKMTDEEANQLADTLASQKGSDVKNTSPKHSVFHYSGIPIENHKHFLNTNSIKLAVSVEEILKQNLNPQTVQLAENNYQINIPSDLFNQIFVAFHAMQHCGCGLCLHHLCDWAVLLKKCELPTLNSLQNKEIMNFMDSLTRCTNLLLETNVQVDNKDTGLQEFILKEMFRPSYTSKNEPANPFIFTIYKTRRKYHCIHRNKKIFKESHYLRETSKSIRNIIKNPKKLITQFSEK